MKLQVSVLREAVGERERDLRKGNQMFALGRIAHGQAQEKLFDLPEQHSVDLSFWSAPRLMRHPGDSHPKFVATFCPLGQHGPLPHVVRAHGRLLKPTGFMVVLLDATPTRSATRVPRNASDDIPDRSGARIPST